MIYKKHHKQLYFLMLIFLVPMFVGWFLYYFHDHFQFNTVNHGTLIKPPITATYLYSDSNAGKQKKWHIIYLFNQPCDIECKKIDYQLHQIQKALGKNYDRVSISVFSSTTMQSKKFQHDLTFAAGNKIYLVDPLGNAFMYYPSTTNPMNILKDLKRVLEVSQIG